MINVRLDALCIRVRVEKVRKNKGWFHHVLLLLICDIRKLGCGRLSTNIKVCSIAKARVT